MAPKRRRTTDSGDGVSTGNGNENGNSSTAERSESSKSGEESCKAVILLGGSSRGTRFRPLSFNLPKPLFPLAGESLLAHHIEACSKIPGLTEILLVGFFDSALYQAFITAAEAQFGIPIKYLREFQAMGTGGGMYHFRDQILRGKPDYIVTLHADVCFGFSLNSVIEFHKQHKNALGTVVGKKVTKDMAQNFGCIVSNEQNEILHYAEKPETFVSDIISCGIYVFNAGIFNKLAEAFQANNEEGPTDVISLENDILVEEAGNSSMFLYVTDGTWGQIKTAGSALLMNNLYLEQYKSTKPEKLAKSSSSGPVIAGLVTIHSTAKIHASAKLGPNVSIGPGVVIEEGVRIKNAVLLDNVVIKKRACILNSVIGWSSQVGEWSRVEGGTNSMIETFPVDGLKKDIATIFGEDVIVGDEVVIRSCLVLPHKELKSNYANEVIM